MKNNEDCLTPVKRGFLKVLLLIKLTISLLLLTTLQLSAKVFSQNRITLTIKSIALKTALPHLERKSDLRSLSNDDIITSAENVSVTDNNGPVTEVWDKLLNASNLNYRIQNNNPVVIREKNNPLADIIVSGKVTDATGNVIPGVTIIVKGAAAGTSTDAQGEYKLSVPDDAVLVFSSVGYEDLEVAVTGRTNINVVLQTSTKSLDQVVVVGYGTQRKRDVTGSVASVKGEDIAKQPVLTATQAIQGKVAGVQIISSGSPNSAPVVRIRGTGSILGGASPLYVVDGVITEDIRNINSADIVTLDVLKDASSAAIYGVRASNGVIIITTKKGRGGKMQVSYDANVGIREASNIVKMANAKQYAIYINEASVNHGNGAILIDSALTNTSTDWFGTILRKAYQQNHNISISGGSDKINYFFSAGYLTDEGIVLNNKFKRFTLRSNNEYKLSDRLKVNTLISYSNGTTQDVNLGGAYNNAYHAAPVIPSKVNGLYGNTSAYQNVGNPVLDIENNNNKYLENRLQGTGYIEYKPVKWLMLRTSYGVELGFNNRRTYSSQFFNDTSTFIVAGGSQLNNKSSLSLSEERNTRWVWDNTVTFQKSINKHDITFLLGTTSERILNQQTAASRSDVPADPSLWYLSQGDPSSQVNNSFADERTRLSYLARLNYTFSKKYLLTATFRRDGSSIFKERYSNSPSVGIGWIITRENFMQQQKIFNNLKLRGSYGRLGNDNVFTAARYVILNTGIPYVLDSVVVNNGVVVSGFVDKNVRWESTDEADLGLEFSVLKSRLSGELDFYHKKVKNALLSVPTPTTTGTESVFTNVASIENKGVELSLNWSDKAGKAITYNISGNVSYNKNTVVALNGGQAIFAGYVGSKGSTTYTNNGQPIGSFYVLQAEGVFHNQGELAAYKASNGNAITINSQLPRLGDLKYKDLNDDGKIDDNDRAFSGSYQPKFTFGGTVGLNYNNFDVSVNLYGTNGSKIFNGKKAARFNSLDNVEASVADERWTFTNYASNVPAAYLTALPQSTYFIESGNFVRINNLTIGYSFKGAFLTKHAISNFRFYMTGQNLLTFTKYSGFTPELSENNPLNQGIEFNAYPTTRTFALGVNLTF
ncbi:MAG: TonB-dependent receptor [Ferruginibacter sp.]|nr:TonB-dependent receptor [Ferruginibacter sp.]